MITTTTEELRLDDGTRKITLVPGLSGKALIEGAYYYTFHLCNKDVMMDDVPVKQWWMDRRSLYPDRGRTAVNYEVIIRYWRASCSKHSTATDESNQEVLILSRLLPKIRSNGARKVFGDAVIEQREFSFEKRKQTLDELDEFLAKSHHEKIDMLQFCEITANCLGPPKYEANVWTKYKQFTAELFGEGKRGLQRYGTDGLIMAEKKWDAWLKSIARRKGNIIEKKVLDILSYECKAAFHQCYSAVWNDLLPHLDNNYNMSDEEYYFHRLWHFDQRFPSNETNDSSFHLFHGHIFALHSAAGDFLCTKTGCKMMADFMKQENHMKFCQLLHGLSVAIISYAQRNNLYALLRKKAPTFVDTQSLEKLEVNKS